MLSSPKLRLKECNSSLITLVKSEMTSKLTRIFLGLTDVCRVWGVVHVTQERAQYVLGQAVTAPVVLTVDLRGTSFMTVESRFSLGGNNYVLTLSLYIITCAI
jgi:hypothetical protein